ncbi:protein kinase [Amycolatopsis sp. NBC_01488]|uniref:serine/threonine-protein kinase n=1 Tax=Amycolatopsis sp. NBC_01488 TaxID=2903563 RepID=UPI002E29DE3B|nr:serine/threonine-protein kinase [Amycolatopsis sp. NBC_01488]
MYEGAVIAGRYRVLGRAGHGATGAVWRAKDERLDRVVALKQLYRDPSLDAAASDRARIIREARLAARLRHPHAVVVYDVVEHEATSYLVMEYLPAETLTEVVEQHGRLSPDYVAELGCQLASALAAAHAAGILHRDVSPNNVLITADGAARIADFGVAHAHGEGTMTGRGLVVGTPAYLAPEVADGGVPGFPSDVFSLGATLYTALEGRPPFGTDENQLALLKRVAHGEIRAPRSTGAVVDAVCRLLRRDPAARPTMAETELLLGRRAAGVSVAPVLERTAPVPPGRRRRSRRTSAVAVAAVVVAGAAAVIGVAAGRATSGATTGRLVSAPPAASGTPEPGTCAARYQVVKSWPGGFQALVTVRNSGPSGIAGWTVDWPSRGTSIDDLWDGTLLASGATATVGSADWNSLLKPGESTTFGFVASGRGGVQGIPVTGCRPAA